MVPSWTRSRSAGGGVRTRGSETDTLDQEIRDPTPVGSLIHVCMVGQFPLTSSGGAFRIVPDQLPTSLAPSLVHKDLGHQVAAKWSWRRLRSASPLRT